MQGELVPKERARLRECPLGPAAGNSPLSKIQARHGNWHAKDARVSLGANAAIARLRRLAIALLSRPYLNWPLKLLSSRAQWDLYALTVFIVAAAGLSSYPERSCGDSGGAARAPARLRFKTKWFWAPSAFPSCR